MSFEVETVPLRMLGKDGGTLSKTDSLTPKFCAKMARGVCAIQSSTLNVTPEPSKLPEENLAVVIGRRGSKQTIVEDEEILVLLIETLHCVCDTFGYFVMLV